MNVTELHIPGVLLIEPRVFGDDRGFFVEQWQVDRYAAAGITEPFVQDNLSKSQRGVLRGLHFQQPNAQAKLVSVPHGRVLDVAVDLRVGSPTFKQHVAVELDGQSQRQLFVPRGMAHGFCVLSEWALFSYKCDARYDKDSERSVRFDDPQLAIEWPPGDWSLSAKDQAAPLLEAIASDDLPRYLG